MHRNGSLWTHLDLRRHDVLRPITLRRRDIPRKPEIRQSRERNVVRPSNAGLEHPPAPHRDAVLLTKIVDGNGVGGFSEAIAIHDLCQKHGIPVWCGGMLETGIGRAHNVALSTLPNFRLPGDVSASK